MKVTLKDIAEASGYSISTVSRVLNGIGNISTEVQKHIIKKAEELNYPFTKAKIPLFSNGNLNIALITDFAEGEFYASFFHGFNRAAFDMGVRISLLNVYDHEQELINVINNLDSHLYDGIVLFLPEMEQIDYLNLKKSIHADYPIVSNAMIQTPLLPTITFDGYSGGHLAAERLLEVGIKEVGIIKGPFAKAESRFRYNGFKDHCDQSGMNITWEYEGDFLFTSGEQAFYEYERIPNRPEGIFISNDLMAKGFLEAAKTHGFCVPQQIKIVSYDDLPMCSQSHPSITSIKTDFTQLGTSTLQMIKDIIAQKMSTRGTLNLIPVTLSVKESA